MVGCCEPESLCSLHREGLFAQLRGTAATRGEVWADDVARVMKPTLPWPPTERMLAIARRKVADLAHDPVLLEQLVSELVIWAARRWDRLRDPDPAR